MEGEKPKFSSFVSGRGTMRSITEKLEKLHHFQWRQFPSDEGGPIQRGNARRIICGLTVPARLNDCYFH